MNTPPVNYYRRASFLISAASPSQFPDEGSIEVAFVGRSNAGKSSAINTLCDNRGLAKISKTPGRTRLVNFFSLDERRYLVDLPGYGYAKVSKPIQREWEKLMEQYLQRGENLRGVVIIMDVRHPLKDFDVQMINWCDQNNLPIHVLLTKADKLKKGPASNTLQAVRKQLDTSGLDTSVQLFSALKKTGLDELGSKLNHWMEL
jgi:GTP-binding protein